MNPAFRQIGNAVPPLMAAAIAEVMLETLRTAARAIGFADRGVINVAFTTEDVKNHGGPRSSKRCCASRRGSNGGLARSAISCCSWSP